MDDALLGIYLNDHLMGATGGLELFRRAARNQRDRPSGPALERLTGEVAQCRQVLISVMTDLGVARRHYKIAGGWLAEKAGRFKPNGRLIGRSPLSDVIELELLRLGVVGQLSMWKILLELAAVHEPLDLGELEDMVARATAFAEELETLRLSAALATFEPGRPIG